MNLFDQLEGKTPNKGKKPVPKNNMLNLEIWADMTSDERNIYYIAEAFSKFMKSRGDTRMYCPSARTKTVQTHDQYGDEVRPADKIRNSKNWQYFKRVWERFETDQAFDAEMFVESIAKHLPKTSKLYPAQLATKKHIKGYLEYRKSVKMRSNQKDEDIKRIMTDIQRTYKIIQRKTGITKLTQKDLYDFFNKPKDNNILSEGLILCIQEMISPYYFSVSKAFLRAYKDADPDVREEIISLDRLKDMRALTHVKTRIYNFVKKIFGDDIL